LGANANDILLIYSPGINPLERISAGVNVLTFCLSPFINVATVVFIKSLITQPTLLMLYLSVLMLIPFGYSLLSPIVIKPLSGRQYLYYLISRMFLLLANPVVNTITYTYSLGCMDDMTWGKTRAIAAAADTAADTAATNAPAPADPSTPPTECSSPALSIDDEMHCPVVENRLTTRQLSELYFDEFITTSV
jgi:hypothetical protein